MVMIVSGFLELGGGILHQLSNVEPRLVPVKVKPKPKP